LPGFIGTLTRSDDLQGHLYCKNAPMASRPQGMGVVRVVANAFLTISDAATD